MREGYGENRNWRGSTSISLKVYLAAKHIESKIEEGSKAMGKVKLEANDLQSVLTNVNELLIDIEGNLELTTDQQVRGLVKNLGQIAYEAEDKVDTFVSHSTALRFPSLGFDTNRASKNLRVLKDRIIKIKTVLGPLASSKKVKSPRGSQAPKGHLPDDGDIVIGIDHEITRIVGLLTRRSTFNDDQAPIKRLAIVGMGGSGKTTLARSIYNHKAVKKHFHFQAWVSVSRGWDTSNVLIDVLKQIRGQKWFSDLCDNDDGQDEDDQNMYLVSQLTELLYKRTCLLVVDDVWDLHSLQEFIALIQGNDTESRTFTIVITSRQSHLSYKNWSIHQPECLNDDDSWKLLSKVASNNSSKAITIEYRTLAMEMLRKCQGLPLAIVALGRLLKTKDTKREWQRVLSQIMGTDATSMYGPVNEILGLSYDELPYHLKPCFLYLGFFPKGSSISGGTLIRMWIAEGFIECNVNEQTPDGKKKLEVAGRRYLQELTDYNMVQVVGKTYSGKTKTIRIHDIMRDFCMLKASDIDFLTASSSEPEAIRKTSRRVAINISMCSIIPTNNSPLRSLSLFGESRTSAAPKGYTSQVNQGDPNLDRVCQVYKLLRVLDIFGIKSPDGTLPKEIGSLIHLTYLRIRSTNIQKLPKSIGKLHNLLTLDYWDVSVDTEVQVPNVLWKLERLRHLYLPNEMSSSVEDLKLHTLKDLITLWGVGGGNWMLKEMDGLNSNLSKLYIHRISTREQLTAVLDCPAMTGLNALALEWYSFEVENLYALGSNKSLQKLRLSGKASDKSYLQGSPFPANLGKLELWYTQLEEPETMALIGKLSFLKVLRLSKDSYIKKEWNVGKKEFPVLEELKLTRLPELEKWDIEEGAMPCLKKLSIVSCIKLEQMPEGLMFIQSLEMLEIERMPYDVISRLQKINEWTEERGEDFHIIEHIPQVKIRDSCSSLVY